MKRFELWVVVTVVVLVWGCSRGGGAPTAPKKAESAPSAAAAKAALEGVAKRGAMGSEMMLLSRYVASLRKSDRAKGEALAKEIDETTRLALAGTPEKMKAKAKEIADKL